MTKRHWWDEKDHGGDDPPSTDRELSPKEEFLWRVAKAIDEVAAQRMRDAGAILRKGRRTKARISKARLETIVAMVALDIARALRAMEL